MLGLRLVWATEENPSLAPKRRAHLLQANLQSGFWFRVPKPEVPLGLAAD